MIGLNPAPAGEERGGEMTVMAEPVAGSSITGSTLSELSARIEGMLQQTPTGAGWWVELVASLDAVQGRLRGASAELDRGAFAEQIRIDAPHLYRKVVGLDEECEALADDVAEVRIAAGRSAGGEGFPAEVSRALRIVLRRLRRWESRSTTVAFDAYDRDIGGE